MTNLLNLEHIVSSGCSFTSNGTGGLPPSLSHPDGACSFVDDPDYPAAEPLSWTGIIAKNLRVKSFVNVAAASHGNLSIATNILTLIRKFNYNPGNTLILFNLSDPARLDLMCDYTNKSKSSHCDWSDQILPYTYLHRESDIVKQTLLSMGINNVELITSTAVLGMMTYLKQHGFDFLFTVMSDYRNHQHLGPVIQEFSEHMVELDPGVSLGDHVLDLNLLAEDNLHPSLQGHHSIALQVLEKIKQL